MKVSHRMGYTSGVSWQCLLLSRQFHQMACLKWIILIKVNTRVDFIDESLRYSTSHLFWEHLLFPFVKVGFNDGVITMVSWFSNAKYHGNKIILGFHLKVKTRNTTLYTIFETDLHLYKNGYSFLVITKPTFIKHNQMVCPKKYF